MEAWINWDEDAIKKRAARLSKTAAKVWAFPELSADVLAAYRVPEESTGYSIVDHPYLENGNVQLLFEAFRKEVLALDPCVTEQFLKLYVAYKAETNFVDVVPQSKRLRLSLNLAFSEINDPKKLCKDVSGVGRWGNGDVEVALDNAEHLAYIIGLVRQSFEKQMGSPSEA